MKYINRIILVFVLSIFASCAYHSYSKKEVIKISKNKQKYAGSITIEENNNTLKVLTRDSNFSKLDEVYQFNDKGKQTKYTVIASCDSCFEKYRKKLLTNKNYKWKKLNDSTYIANYNFKQYLHIHKSIFAYDIVQHNLSKSAYKNLITSVEN